MGMHEGMECLPARNEADQPQPPVYDEDTAQALQLVKNCVAVRDQWAALLD
jgi:hypothetical protein